MNVTYDESTYKIVEDAIYNGRLIGNYIRGIDLVWNETVDGIQTYMVYRDDNNSIFKIEKFNDLVGY